MSSLTEIKVGDRVWISAPYGGGDKGEIKTVKRLTPTQVILDGQYEQYNRYHRGRITAIATKAECEQWDAEQERKQRAASEAQVKREADEQKRIVLNSLLPEKASISGPHRNSWGEWQINIYATEGEVREIAARLHGILSTPLQEV